MAGTPERSDKLRPIDGGVETRKGGLRAASKKRLVDGACADRGYAEQFAWRQIWQAGSLASGEYGFESHSASFALLVYVSSWLKCYEPAAFTCALLNSQPMGFYSPSQLTQDLRRHGGVILPADVCISEVECTLEQHICGDNDSFMGAITSSAFPQNPPSSSPRKRGSILRPSKDQWIPAFAGMTDTTGPSSRTLTALRRRPPHSASGLCTGQGLSSLGKKSSPHAQPTLHRRRRPSGRRANLNRHDMEALAAAGALSELSGHRRSIWGRRRRRRMPPLLADASIDDAPPTLIAPTEGEDIVADFAHLGLTLGRHPLALLRERLQAQHMLTAADLRNLPHGRITRVTGLVTGRQRPGTASGVTFVTLEDETGMINVIVWRDLAERQRKELLRSNLLTVYGTLERAGEVVHLIAGRLRDQSALLGKLTTRSRDFH